MYDDRNRGRRYGNHEGQRERRGTPLSDLDPNLTEMSRKVIGAAIEVHRALGPGYDESVYAGALKQELDGLGVAYKAGHRFDVRYKDHVVGGTTADLWVGDRFVVEVMARTGEIGGAERASLRAQLRAADVELGLIINFGERRLKDGLVRVLNPDKLNAMRGDEEDGDDEYEDEDGE